MLGEASPLMFINLILIYRLNKYIHILLVGDLTFQWHVKLRRVADSSFVKLFPNIFLGNVLFCGDDDTCTCHEDN